MNFFIKQDLLLANFMTADSGTCLGILGLAFEFVAFLFKARIDYFEDKLMQPSAPSYL